MTTKDEALKLADDLENEFYQGRISNYTGRKAAQMLRELAQPEQYTDIVSDGGLDPRNKFDAQPTSGDYALGYAEGFNDACKKPEQEPVAWMSKQDVGFKKSEFGATPTVPLYTTPPQRKPLTDEQILALSYDGNNFCIVCDDNDAILIFSRAIEAAHGIKE